MKTYRDITAIVLLSLALQEQAHATCETNAFVESVNATWVATNYTLLKQTITNRLVECTNDILALGLLYEYYDNICVDFYNARSAASSFVVAVSNRLPSEITYERVPVGEAISLAQMPTPTNFPANQSKTPEQMQFLHEWYPAKFPHIDLYLLLIKRIEGVEAGTLTEEDLIPLNEVE